MSGIVITIGREYFTGGNEIATALGDALGIPVYDKELITIAAKKSGLSEEAIAASEKQHTRSLLYSLYTLGNELPLGDQVFILQSKIIRELAAEGSCVIVGRCGDYVLREEPNVLRVFAYGDLDYRIARAMKDSAFQWNSEAEVRDEVQKTDKRRASYYNYYTQNRWGDAHNYDIAVNAQLGIAPCVAMIQAAVKAKEAQGVDCE